MPAHQRPPSAGRVSGWRPEAGPSLEEAADLLATCELVVEGRLPWSSNLTFLVSLEGTDEEQDDGRGPVQAVYKPHRGEQSLWDFPDGLYRREVAAFRLSEVLGWGLVPPTVVREDAPFGAGSVQLFIDSDYERHYFTLFEDGGREAELLAFCAFDVVANNADRKSGHVLVAADERLWGIDHGLCFHVLNKLRTVIWEFAGEELPTRIVDDLDRLVTQGPPAALSGLLSESEVEAMLDRAGRLVVAGAFPEPVGDRPPYPWPLV
jgi:uncharacterized repeat protein (TIGR03843 family)